MTFRNCRFAYRRKFVFLLQLFQPPFQVSILVLQSHFITAFNAPSLCGFALSSLALPLSLRGGNCTLRLQFCLHICQSFSNRRSFSLLKNSFFSLFSLFFFFNVRRVFVFARAALCPVASLTNLQQQKSLKYGRLQPRLVWYISESALRYV